MSNTQALLSKLDKLTISVEFPIINHSTNSYSTTTLQLAGIIQRLIIREKKRCDNIRLKQIKINSVIANEIWASQFNNQDSTSNAQEEGRQGHQREYHEHQSEHQDKDRHEDLEDIQQEQIQMIEKHVPQFPITPLFKLALTYTSNSLWMKSN